MKILPLGRAGLFSSKLYPACIFNHFLRPPAAHSDDVTLRHRPSQSPVRTSVIASLSAPARPYTKINVLWNRGSKRCNFSNFDVYGFRQERLHGPDTRAGLNRSAFPHKEIATCYAGLSSLTQYSFLPLAYGTLRLSLKPVDLTPIPEEKTRVAKAAFPSRCNYQIDLLGPIVEEPNWRPKITKAPLFRILKLTGRTGAHLSRGQSQGGWREARAVYGMEIVYIAYLKRDCSVCPSICDFTKAKTGAPYNYSQRSTISRGVTRSPISAANARLQEAISSADRN